MPIVRSQLLKIKFYSQRKIKASKTGSVVKNLAQCYRWRLKLVKKQALLKSTSRGQLSKMDTGITGTYNIGLVGLSLASAIVASYTALNLAGRVQSALKSQRLFWILGGAVAMGTGIWSMHFVAMLAFQLPVPVSYSVWLTLLSLLCAISASAIALWLLISSQME